MISHGGGTGAKDDSLRFLLHLDPIQLLHVVAALFWIVGVVRVAVAFRDPARGVAAARQFRVPAAGLLTVVVVTGLRNAAPHFRFGSAWSWLLLAKVALVAFAVGLGLRWRARVEVWVLGVVAVIGVVLGATVPVTPLTTVLFSVPIRPSAACEESLAGALVAARTIGATVKTFRSDGCGVLHNGAAATLDWSAAGRAAATALAGRGVSSARVVGDGDATFVAGVRAVLSEGDGAVFVTDRAALTRLAATTQPVVLAPWLLAPRNVVGAQSLLVAAQRDLTDELAIDYRTAATQARRAPTGAGLEGFVDLLAAVGGRPATTPRPGLFAVSRIEVMPPGYQHGAHSGEWSPGIQLIRLSF